MKKGFTIPELLVAIALFSLIAGAGTNLLFSAIDAQRRSLAGQEMVSQASFIMEYMTRALRQAKKELVDPGLCLSSGSGYNYEITDTGEGGVRFINAQNNCQEFYLESGTVWEVINEDLPKNLTANDFTVTQFSFVLQGESQDLDLLQPRVTLLLALESVSSPESDLRLQTTISQRNVDIVR